MFLCLVLEGKNQNQCPILMGWGWNSFRHEVWNVDGFIANMWQSWLVTRKNMFPLHTPSLRRLFSRIPMMNVLVIFVESLSSWVTILLWTWTTTTMNVTSAMNILLVGKLASPKSTWNCALPPAMVTPTELATGVACLIAFVHCSSQGCTPGLPHPVPGENGFLGPENF